MANVTVGGTAYEGVQRVRLPLTSNSEQFAEFVEPNFQEKSVAPATQAQTIAPDEGYSALSSVTVGAVTAGIDANIQAENIRAGVQILGVEGGIASYAGALTITPGAQAQTLATAGRIMPGDVTVGAVDLTSHVVFGTLTRSSTSTSITVSGLGFTPAYFLLTWTPNASSLSSGTTSVIYSAADGVKQYIYYANPLWWTGTPTITVSSGAITVSGVSYNFGTGTYSYLAVG